MFFLCKVLNLNLLSDNFKFGIQCICLPANVMTYNYTVNTKNIKLDQEN